MTHIAIQEALDGKVVDWMEKVTDDLHISPDDPRTRPCRDSQGYAARD
jgi:hypothetical protein